MEKFVMFRRRWKSMNATAAYLITANPSDGSVQWRAVEITGIKRIDSSLVLSDVIHTHA